MSGLAVVIPTLNDAENLERLLSKLEIIAPFSKIFVIDDDSIDNSANIAKKYNAIVPYTFKFRGLGQSYAEGIAMAVYEHNCEIIFIMDADHTPEFMPAILKKLYEEDLDMVIGFEKDNRTTASLGAGFIAKSVLGLNDFEQPTCGYMCFTSELIQKIGLKKLKSFKDFYHVELLYFAKKVGAKIGQLEFKGHKHGSSSLSRIFFWLSDLVGMKIREGFAWLKLRLGF